MVRKYNCQAIRDRATLTAQLQLAALPHIGVERLVMTEGTQEELNLAFSTLRGIVQEYQDDGDQMIEACTCGNHEGKWKNAKNL